MTILVLVLCALLMVAVARLGWSAWTEGDKPMDYSDGDWLS